MTSKVITGNQARQWRMSLGLSATQAGETLNLSNPSVTFREYERAGTTGGKSPAPPTIALMDITASVALALVNLRRGDVSAAARILMEALPTPVLKNIEAMAAGTPIEHTNGG